MKREEVMALAAFCQAVRSRWHTLTQLVWPSTPEELARAEIQHRRDELALFYQKLLQRRSRIEQVRDRLAAQQRHIEKLSSLAASGTAADGAAEPSPILQCSHRALQRYRDRLLRLEKAYERRRHLFHRKKQLLLALARGEVVVVAAEQGEEPGFPGD
jgi:hypothetical protein